MRDIKRLPTPGPGAIGIVSVSCVLCFALMAAQQGPSAPSDDTGQAVFRAKGCVNCHAVYGYGGDQQPGRSGPDLGEKQFYGTYLDLAATMWNHFPMMFQKMKKAGYEPPELSKDEMAKIVSYLSSIRFKGEPGHVNTGRKLLTSKQCRSCHTFGGKGGAIGPDFTRNEDYLSPLALVASMWNHGPDMMALFDEHNIKRPEFNGHEMVDLTTAIRSYMAPTYVPPGSFVPGDPERGKQRVEEKNCVHCHALRGVGGTTGPDFSDMDLEYSVTEIAGEMWNHGPAMWDAMQREGIAFSTFEQEEMADIISYLYTLKLEDAPGDEAQGAETVRAKQCLACHVLRGEGEGLSQGLAALDNLESPLAMVTDMWNHAAAMEQEHLKRNLKWLTLTGRDLADLYAYLRAIAPPEANE